MDKGEVVRQAAAAATKAILKLFPPESFRLVYKTLEGVLESGKWRTKTGALDAMRMFVIGAEEAVATELGMILPAVTAAMHDTKNEVCHVLIVQLDVR
jgi:elongation factor 3